MPAVAEAEPDWWIITQVAQRMGYGKAFPIPMWRRFFREHARLSGFENEASSAHAVQRAFDISALSELSDAEYDALEPVQWPSPAKHRKVRSVYFPMGNFIRRVAKRA